MPSIYRYALKAALPLHGLAPDRDTLEYKPIGFADKDNIMVHAWKNNLQNLYEGDYDGIENRTCPDHVLFETKDVALFFSLYLQAMRAGAEINKQRISYEMLSTNSNAAACTILSACGLQLPSHLNGIAPGRENDLLSMQGVNVPSIQRFSNDVVEFFSLRETLSVSICLLAESHKKKPDELGFFAKHKYYNDLGSITTIACLVRDGYPVHEMLVRYTEMSEQYDELSFSKSRVSYQELASMRTALTGLHAGIKKEFDIEMTLPYALRRDAPRTIHIPGATFQI